MKEKKRISLIGRIALKITFAILAGAIEMIKDAVLKNYISFQVDTVEGMVNVLTDRDPDNKKQLGEFWRENWKKETGENITFIVAMINRHTKEGETKNEVLEILGAAAAQIQMLENV